MVKYSDDDTPPFTNKITIQLYTLPSFLLIVTYYRVRLSSFTENQNTNYVSYLYIFEELWYILTRFYYFN